MDSPKSQIIGRATRFLVCNFQNNELKFEAELVQFGGTCFQDANGKVKNPGIFSNNRMMSSCYVTQILENFNLPVNFWKIDRTRKKT